VVLLLGTAVLEVAELALLTCGAGLGLVRVVRRLGPGRPVATGGSAGDAPRRRWPKVALIALAVYWVSAMLLSFAAVSVAFRADLLMYWRAGRYADLLLLWGVAVAMAAVAGPVVGPARLLVELGRAVPTILSTLVLVGAVGLGGLVVVGVVGASLIGLGYLVVNSWGVLSPVHGLRRQADEHARVQGRVPMAEVLRRLALPPARLVGPWQLEPGLPLGYIAHQDARAQGVGASPIGVPPDGDTGHVAVIAPTRSGKSFHLTDTLLRWPGPAVVIDPKGEQWERTAGFRARHYGPVYRLPPQGLDLADLYDLDADLDLRELHEVLLRPWRDGEQRIFADKSFALFEAAVQCGRAAGEHPLRVLGRWARQSPVVALAEAERVAPAAARTFTDGAAPERLIENRFALSAWGTFSTRFSPFAAHLDTVARGDVPVDWARCNATLYITYPLQTQAAVGPLAAALIAGLIRRLQAERPPARVLCAVDEMPTVGLPHLAASLATVGGAGITMLLYAQSVPQIEATYGREEALSILSNCTHQVFFAPRDPQTAQMVSEAFGSELEVTTQFGTDSVGYATRYHPALEVGKVLSLPAGRVAVFSQGLRHVAGDSRGRMAGVLAHLPSPPAIVAPTTGTSPVPTPFEVARDEEYW